MKAAIIELNKKGSVPPGRKSWLSVVVLMPTGEVLTDESIYVYTGAEWMLYKGI